MKAFEILGILVVAVILYRGVYWTTRRTLKLRAQARMYQNERNRSARADKDKKESDNGNARNDARR